MFEFSLLFVVLFTITLSLKIYLALRQTRWIAKHAWQVPAPFDQHITLEEHQKAARYNIKKLKLSLFELLFDSFWVLAMTLLGGLFIIRSQLGNSFGFNLHPFWFDWALVFGVMGALALVSLPIEIYRQFKLEGEFGFNTMTTKLFVQDQIKTIVLSLLLGTPILFAVLWCFYHVEAWWLYAWLILTGVQLVLMFVFPTWIAPLFNKFSPLPEGSLKDRILALVKRVGVDAKAIYVVDGSKRSKHANAYFTGFGKNKRIVLYDTLLEQLNEDEIEAVLAHELGHMKHNHIVKGMVISLVMSGLLFWLLGFLSSEPLFYASLGAPVDLMLPVGSTALILFMWVMPYVLFGLSPLGSWFSRRNEFEADRFAARHSQSEYLQSALLKLYKENASSVVADPWYVAFYASHPPIIQRLAALKAVQRAQAVKHS